MLVGAGVRIGLVADGLQCPLGILELHLFVSILLWIQLLFAIPLAGWHTILTLLLVLRLTELFHKLPNLLALLGAVAPRVMHRASRATIATTKRLTGVLVPVWTMTLSKHNNDRSSGDARDGVTNLGELLDKGAK
jgi:hypothetical protein